MQQKPRVLGAAIVLLVLAGIVFIAPGGHFSSFVDLLLMALFVGIVVGGLLIGFSPSVIVRSFRAAILGDDNSQPDVLNQYISVFRRTYQLAWAAGIVSVVIGTVITLTNLDDPVAIGPAFAVALLGVLYAAVFAELVIRPLEQSLMSSTANQRVEQPVQQTTTVPQTSMISAGMAMLLGMMSAVLLLMVILQRTPPPIPAEPISVTTPAPEIRVETQPEIRVETPPAMTEYMQIVPRVRTASRAIAATDVVARR